MALLMKILIWREKYLKKVICYICMLEEIWYKVYLLVEFS